VNDVFGLACSILLPLRKPMERNDQATELFDAADAQYEHQAQLDRERELYDALNECASKGISKESLRVLARETGGTTWALQNSLKA
jgi:hypothetical protein